VATEDRRRLFGRRLHSEEECGEREHVSVTAA
jgi:hypothetical protein